MKKNRVIGTSLEAAKPALGDLQIQAKVLPESAITQSHPSNMAVPLAALI
jgi:hypothetical protein